MKRILAILLTLVMVISLLPISVFANDGEQTDAVPEETLVLEEQLEETDPAQAGEEDILPEEQPEETDPVQIEEEEQPEETEPAPVEGDEPIQEDQPEEKDSASAEEEALVLDSQISKADAALEDTSTEAETIDIPVQIVWNDDENAEGIRYDGEYALLYADGEYVQRAYPDADGKCMFEDVPKFNSNGKEIDYTVDIYYAYVEVLGMNPYKKAITQENDGFVITMTAIAIVNVSVKVIWNDNNNASGKRPSSVSAYLNQDDWWVGFDGYIELSDSNDWTHTFKAPKFDNRGNELTYTVEVSSDYKKEVTEVDGCFVFTLTDIPRIDIPVKVIWDDNNNAAGIRPSYITLYLEDEFGWITYETLSDANQWSFTFKDRPVYRENGEEIPYRVSSDYMQTYTRTTTKEDGGFVITYTPVETTEIPVKIVWEDNNNAGGTRPSYVYYRIYRDGSFFDSRHLYNSDNWTYTHISTKYNQDGEESTFTIEVDSEFDLYNRSVTKENGGFVITYTLVETAEIPVKVVWAEGSSISEVKVRLYNGDTVVRSTTMYGYGYEYSSNYDRHTFSAPKYDSEGREISYSVKTAPGHFIPTITKEDGVTVITLTPVPPISIPVWIVWEDNDNAYGDRPNNQDVTLYQDGEHYEWVKVYEDWGWTFSFQNLPKYNGDGKEIDYSLIAIDVDTSTYDVTVTEENGGFVVTMTHAAALPVKVVWEDDNNAYHDRPDSLYVGVNIDGEQIASGYIYSDEGWYHLFETERYDENSEFTMSVHSWGDGFQLYTIKNLEYENNCLVLTMTRRPTVELPVRVVWDDNNNEMGVRPYSISVWLYRNGEYLKSMDIHVDDEWEKTFSIVKENTSEEDTYSLEIGMDGFYYTPTVTQDENGFVVTCSIAELREIPVQIVWNDNNNAEGGRPSGVEVDLFVNWGEDDTEYMDYEYLEGENDWSCTFLVPKNTGFRTPTYEIRTYVSSPIYEESITEENGGFVVTMTRLASVDVPVKVVWDDNNNAEGDRPYEIELYLHQNGEEFMTKYLCEDDADWDHTFKAPKYNKDGEEYSYSISVYPGSSLYKETITKEDGVFVVTLTRVPSVTIPVRVVWDDEDNAEGDRPYEIEVYLLKNGEEYRSRYLWVEEGERECSFKVPKYDNNGEECAYSVTAYTGSSLYKETVTKEDGVFVITLTRVPAVEIPVKIIWNDDNDAAGYRPWDVRVSLYDADTLVASRWVSEDDDWTRTFQVPKYDDNGEEVSYSVKTEADFYTATVAEENGGFVITLTYVPGADIPVKVIWVDDNDAKGERPSYVEIYLNGGDEYLDYIQVDASNEWTYTFRNMPTVSGSEELSYSIDASYEGEEESLYIEAISKKNDGFVITYTYAEDRNPPNRPTIEDPKDPEIGEDTDDPEDNPNNDPFDEPVDDPTDPPADDPAEPPVDDPTDPPADDPAEPPADDPTEPPGNSGAKDPAVPVTGDTAQLALWGGLLAIAVIGLAVVFCLLGKKRKENA